MSWPDAVVARTRRNAAGAWLLVALLAAAAVGHAALGRPIWAVFVAGVLGLLLVPAGHHRDASVMPAWELVAATALPVVGAFLALPELLADLTVHWALLAVGVLVVVELHGLTPVEMTPRFAVVFLALATLAAAGLWAILQFASDVYVGTALVGTKTALMWELVLGTAVGLVASPLVAAYFGWLDAAGYRSPEGEPS